MKRIFAALGALGAALAILFAANGAVNAQSGNTWNLFYYNNTNWAGNPIFTAAVPFLNFNWGGAPPAGNMPGVNWTMTATTTAFFNGGTYQFSALADDEVLVMVDNLSIIDTRGRNQVGKWQNSTIGLTTGNHNVQVFYRQYGGTSYLKRNRSRIRRRRRRGPPPCRIRWRRPPPHPSPRRSAIIRRAFKTAGINQNVLSKMAHGIRRMSVRLKWSRKLRFGAIANRRTAMCAGRWMRTRIRPSRAPSVVPKRWRDGSRHPTCPGLPKSRPQALRCVPSSNAWGLC
ncbi:MAG: hypothetical protein DCC52_13985 [Chloroflexi bacterium]|nr:MAG: hypothetical protein DCC52_13985 [Chloroflexota bacterium]